MGLQYYSVMMEQRSYLFYVYFSHKELKIVDEEGKTIYTTQVRIVTTKNLLDLFLSISITLPNFYIRYNDLNLCNSRFNSFILKKKIEKGVYYVLIVFIIL